MPPTVAFFPGASGSGAFWQPVADRLPRAWRTRLLNWPGAGAQPHDRAINRYEDLIRFAARRVPDGSDVVAQSMGGLVALGLAFAFPTKIRRLVLVAASGGLDVESRATEDWREQYVQEFPQAATWVSQERVDYTMRLAEITAPTCLIWGDRDTISPPEVGHALHGRLPSSDLHVIPDATHSLAREHPAAVAELVVDHLR